MREREREERVAEGISELKIRYRQTDRPNMAEIGLVRRDEKVPGRHQRRGAKCRPNRIMDHIAKQPDYLHAFDGWTEFGAFLNFRPRLKLQVRQISAISVC